MYEEYLVFGATVLIVGYMWHYFMRGILAAPGGDHIETQASACASPDCIRCLGHKHTRDAALERYQRFLATHFTSPPNDGDKVNVEISSIGDYIRDYESSTIKASRGREHCPTVFYHADLKCKPYYDLNDVGDSNAMGLMTVKDHVHVLRDAYDMARHHYPRGWHVNDTPQGSWELFSLINQGSITPHAAHLCPQLIDLLQGASVGGIRLENSFGFAGFSVVHPSTLIEAHNGLTNVRIRTHLTLESGCCDEDVCELVVAGEARRWRTEELLMFDDSYQHSVRYTPRGDGEGDGDVRRSGPRVVFILDLWHPGVTTDQRRIISHVYQSHAEPDGTANKKED